MVFITGTGGATGWTLGDAGRVGISGADQMSIGFASGRGRLAFIQFSFLHRVRRLDPGHRGFVRLDHAVAGGVRVDQTAVDVHLGAIDQARFDALLDGAHEQLLEQLAAPAGSRFRQHTVVGHLVIEAVAEKPQPVQSLGQPSHQLPLAAHVFLEEQKHQFQQHHRIDRDMAVVAIGMRHRLAHKTEVDHRLDPAQRVIGVHSAIQIHRVTEQLLLRVVFAHHNE